ncbi:uncharacterized protein LOC115891120 [Sitophilus oryzae]|uniref:Uncharacterized protein LOC115891120 n=1 Tax=Sitophilus oryzae TaxID=7048 RepID=A0A6J2YVS4_SITOR|nr:uncharacterized protein LOC115891120 [Sitophilus oryzae]
MWWSTLKWLFFGLSLALMSTNVSKAAPSRDENMYRELMKLDQLYSSIARPSLRSVSMPAEIGQKVQRALQMLRLQQLDDLYAHKSRPRFGKRGDGHNLPAADYETNQIQYRNNQDGAALQDWLPLRR